MSWERKSRLCASYISIQCKANAKRKSSLEALRSLARRMIPRPQQDGHDLVAEPPSSLSLLICDRLQLRSCIFVAFSRSWQRERLVQVGFAFLEGEKGADGGSDGSIALVRG